MTVKDIEDRIKEIIRQGGGDPLAEDQLWWDDERAHHLEDNLYADVFKAIAEGAKDADLLAKAVLRTKELAFERWFA